MKYSIFINEAQFTADEATIDLVVAAITSHGFVFDDETEGYVTPDFYADGPCGAPLSPTEHPDA